MPRPLAQRQLYTKVALGFLGFYVLQLGLSSVVLYTAAICQTTSHLESIASRIKEDLAFKNGQWDMSRYNADPQLPGTYPLYLITTDGFVLDRWRPIHGFLDTSDVQQLLGYTAPQTVHTVSNQSWRMLSKPILNGQETFGAVTVAFFNPPDGQEGAIDQKLSETLQKIASKAQVVQGKIDISALDSRDIDYDVSFQVTDRFNRVVAKNENTNSINRMPTYVERSSVASQLTRTSITTVVDSSDDERFLMHSFPLLDSGGETQAIVVVGESVSQLSQLLMSFLAMQALLSATLLCGLVAYLSLLMRRSPGQPGSQATAGTAPQLPEIKRIRFDSERSVAEIDGQAVSVPYASNQYYLCQALLAEPNRRFEADELLELFGETDAGNWRQVYDAVNLVNRRMLPVLQDKLIVVKDKTYRVNERFGAAAQSPPA
jgi:hypothetical protein